jgi:hypothetical protein
MILLELRDLLKNRFTKEERLIIYCIISLFLPCYICAIFLLLIVCYLIYTKQLQQCFHNIKGSKYLLLFSLLSLITSLIHKNYLGALLTLVIPVIFAIIVFYMNYIHKNLFELILDILIFMSILAAIYGLIEYIMILNRMNIKTFEIVIFDSRHDRINSVFFNANYYAMMIEFFVLMCFYKAFNLKLRLKHLISIAYYTIVIALNLFMLYLTGCRSAWPALAVGIFVLLYFNHHYKSVTILSTVLICGIIGILCFPNIFPRVDNIISYFFTRQNIWKTALKALKDNWVIGQGPLTYYHVAKQYGGHVTHHAHNVYIDPFLSHGVLGVACLVPFIKNGFKGCMQVAKMKVDRSYLALVLSFIFVVLIHGITDYTIYFVQTSFVFFLVLTSFSMYTRKDNV